MDKTDIASIWTKAHACMFSPFDNNFEGRSQGVAYNAAFLRDNSAKV